MRWFPGGTWAERPVKFCKPTVRSVTSWRPAYESGCACPRSYGPENGAGVWKGPSRPGPMPTLLGEITPMTPYALALLPLIGLGAVSLLVYVLTTVYLWSNDAGRRSRAWRVLQALLHAAERERPGDA